MRLLAACALSSFLTVCVLAWTADGHYKPGKHNAKHAVVGAFCHGNNNLEHACPLGRQALTVAGCETGWTYSPWASNGIYLGLFQVSPHWRATVRGWGRDPWSQARHAYRVFRLTGGWSHWECAYLMGIL